LLGQTNDRDRWYPHDPLRPREWVHLEGWLADLPLLMKNCGDDDAMAIE